MNLIKNKSIWEEVISQLKNHEFRILRLESKPVSDSQPKKDKKGKSLAIEYSGPAGGVRFLLNTGFLKVKRNLSSIREELKKNDYNYPRQSVNTALGRLSGIKGPLVTLKEGGKKVYVKRK